MAAPAGGRRARPRPASREPSDTRSAAEPHAPIAQQAAVGSGKQAGRGEGKALFKKVRKKYEKSPEQFARPVSSLFAPSLHVLLPQGKTTKEQV